jgi:hypothetical protein
MGGEHLLYCPKLDTKQTTAQEHHQTLLECQSDDEITSPIMIIIIIVIQSLGRSGQRPELSQATGMVLVGCILGKFLGVVCHYFPPV